MCKHILNAQVSVRAPCCHRWFDCPQCHAEQSDHKLRRTMEVTMICKKCKKAFRKDMADFEVGADDRCPACDNLYVLPAKTPGDLARKNEAGDDDDSYDDRELRRSDNRLAAHLDERVTSRRTLVAAARRELDEAVTERIDEGGWAAALRSAREAEKYGGGGSGRLFLGSARDEEDEREERRLARAREDGAERSASASASASAPGLMDFDDAELDWS